MRILAGLVASAQSLDDDGAAVLVERLAGLQGALAVLDHPARRHGLPIVLVELTTGSGHGLVQGAPPGSSTTLVSGPSPPCNVGCRKR